MNSVVANSFRVGNLMKKNSKNQNRKNATTSSRIPSAKSLTDTLTSTVFKIDRSEGPVGRTYPPMQVRDEVVATIRTRPEESRSALDWYTLGSLLVYQGCLDENDGLLNEGINCLMRAASATPPDPEAVLDLCWILAFRRLEAMAVHYAIQATELMPDRRDAWRFRANCHLALKQREQALECMKKVVVLAETSPEDHELLADLKSGKDVDFSKAVMGFAQLGYLSNQWNKQEKLPEFDMLKLQLFYLKQMLAAQPNSLELLKANGQIRYFLSQYEEAERILSQVIHLRPDDADAWTMLALIHQKTERLDTSREFYCKALRADPDHLRANTNLAKILLDEGRPQQARDLLNRALAKNPDDPVALDLYGNTVAYIEEDYAEEAKYHARAIELEPSKPEYRMNHVVALMQSGSRYHLAKAWRKHRLFFERLQHLPQARFVAHTVVIILDPPSDPLDCVCLALDIYKVFKGKAVLPLVEAAWAQRHSIVDDAEASQFTLNHIGMLAGHAGKHQLALQAFEAVERHFPGTGSTLNVAVGLGRVGRVQEAVAKARACDPGQPRSLTVLANLLWDAGNHKEAFSTYLRAIEVDRDFLLPLTNAVKLAARAEQPGRLDDLLEVLRLRFSDSLDARVIRAEALVVRGRPSEAAKLLAETLCRDGVPKRIVDIKCDQKKAAFRLATSPNADALSGLVDDEVTGDDDEPHPPDLTLFGESMTDARVYYAFGLALLKSKQYGALSKLYSWIATEGLVNGDWTVLMAEKSRAEQQYEQALQIARSVKRQPPPLITEALTLHAQGEGLERIEPLLSGVLSTEFQGKVFNHPEGNPVAVALAIQAFLAMGQDDHPAAEENARKAIDADQCCAMAWATLARALDLQKRHADAVKAALQGLAYCPGDIDLVQWTVERHLDAGHFKEADAVLDAHRAAIESQGQQQFTLWLGEAVARRQLKAQEMQRPAVKFALAWPWLSQLQPDSRDWIEDAENGARALPWLRLGIAIYFCKVAELELIARLVDPFVTAHPNAGGPGNDLRDIRDYLGGTRPPSIGGILHALRAAAQPGGYHDSRLLRIWRNFVRSRTWASASQLFNASFLKHLERLADVRKRVAHLGDLSDAELTMFRTFLIDHNNPGLLLIALGIEPHNH